jgi:hypothetical protein
MAQTDAFPRFKPTDDFLVTLFDSEEALIDGTSRLLELFEQESHHRIVDDDVLELGLALFWRHYIYILLFKAAPGARGSTRERCFRARASQSNESREKNGNTSV